MIWSKITSSSEIDSQGQILNQKKVMFMELFFIILLEIVNGRRYVFKF
jgi:hypothetical protein